MNSVRRSTGHRLNSRTENQNPSPLPRPPAAFPRCHGPPRTQRACQRASESAGVCASFKLRGSLARLLDSPVDVQGNTCGDNVATCDALSPRDPIPPPNPHTRPLPERSEKIHLLRQRVSINMPCDRPGPLVHIATSAAWHAHAGRNLVQRLKHLPSLPQGARTVRIYSTARAETCLTFRLHGSRPTPRNGLGARMCMRAACMQESSQIGGVEGEGGGGEI